MGRFRFRPSAEASGLPRNLWITHTSGSAYCATTLLLLWIVALWRPALEATLTNLSIPELPVNCSAQLFLPASTLSICVDLFMPELREYSSSMACSGALVTEVRAHDKTACGPLSATHVETATPKRNIKLKRSLSLAGGTLRVALLPFGRPLAFF